MSYKHVVLAEKGHEWGVEGLTAQVTQDVEDIPALLALNPGWTVVEVENACPPDCSTQLATGADQ